MEAGNSSLSLFEVSGDSSYKCEHLQTVDVLDSLVNITLGVNLQDYQVQAFQISSEKDTAEFDTGIPLIDWIRCWVFYSFFSAALNIW